MSIADDLTRIQTAKSDLRTAIQGKGVSVPSSAMIDDFPDYVDAIQQGGGSSKNVQVAAGVNRVATTTYTAVSGQSLTVSKTGSYDVYWTGFRSSTGGTNGSQLYIGSTAYGTVQTTFSNHGQAVHLTSVSLTQGETVSVRARARGTSYYMYVANLTIIEQ